MSQMNPEDTFLTLSQSVRKNIKTGKEELEIALFDMRATDSDGAVVTITAKDYEVNRRTAQQHEIERAERKLMADVKGSWVEQLADQN